MLKTLPALHQPKGVATRNRNTAIKAKFGVDVYLTLPEVASLSDEKIQEAIDIRDSCARGEMVSIHAVRDQLNKLSPPITPRTPVYFEVAGFKTVFNPFENCEYVPAAALPVTDHMDAVVAAIKAYVDNSQKGLFMAMWKILRTPDFEMAALASLMD